MTESPHRVVTAVLRKKGQVLLCHRRGDRQWFPDVWDLPGGHVETGERDRDAIVRELREELGIVAQLPSGEPYDTLTDTAAGIEIAIWIVDSWQGDVVNAAPQEHDEVGWFSAADIASLRLAHPAYVGLLRKATSV